MGGEGHCWGGSLSSQLRYYDTPWRYAVLRCVALFFPASVLQLSKKQPFEVPALTLAVALRGVSLHRDCKEGRAEGMDAEMQMAWSRKRVWA